MRIWMFLQKHPVLCVRAVVPLTIFWLTVLASGASSDEYLPAKASELALLLSSSLHPRGLISNIDVEIDQCVITITKYYDRPCNEKLKGMFVLKRTEYVDLTDLSSNATDIKISPFGAPSEIVNWQFEKEVGAKSEEIAQTLLGYSRNKNDREIDLNYSSLNELSKKLLKENNIVSSVNTELCLEDSESRPFLFGRVELVFLPGKKSAALEEMLAYKTKYCQRK